MEYVINVIISNKCYTPDYILKEGDYFINEYTCANCLENYYNKKGKCVTDSEWSTRK